MYIICSSKPYYNNMVAASTNPVIHKDFYDAEKECERLSRANPGRTFIIFKAVQSGFVAPCDYIKTNLS